MGSLLEEMHKMRLKEKIEELEKTGIQERDESLSS